MTILDFVDQLTLVLLESWLLFLNYNTEALFFETLLFNREIDHVDLCGNLWCIVWVRYSSSDIQLEFWVVSHFGITYFDSKIISTLLDERFV